MVAESRGAVFEYREDYGAFGYFPQEGLSVDIAHDALQEVTDWLGYGDTDAYLRALPLLGPSIFDHQMC